MSSFHGLFSLGGLAGAALAGVAMAAGMGDVPHVVVTALACVIVVLGCLPFLLPSPVAAGSPGPVFARPRGALLSLGALAFCGLIAEGAMGDWSAVYLHDTLGSSPALASAGFAACSLAMAAGRFTGDALVRRYGAARVLRVSSTVAAIGLVGALLVGTPASGVVGFGLVGLGVANVIPILFSAAGRVPGTAPGTGIAAVATTGYFGFLVGPPVIDFVVWLRKSLAPFVTRSPSEGVSAAAAPASGTTSDVLSTTVLNVAVRGEADPTRIPNASPYCSTVENGTISRSLSSASQVSP